MNAPPHREIACAIIIDTAGRFLFQQRDNVPGIFQPGKVTLFGGHREGDESFLECVAREIHEEISYFVPAERFEYLVTFDGADIDADGGSIRAEFFVARDIPLERLAVTEGSLQIAEPDEIIKLEHKLTPLARFALKIFGVSGL